MDFGMDFGASDQQWSHKRLGHFLVNHPQISSSPQVHYRYWKPTSPSGFFHETFHGIFLCRKSSRSISWQFPCRWGSPILEEWKRISHMACWKIPEQKMEVEIARKITDFYGPVSSTPFSMTRGCESWLINSGASNRESSWLLKCYPPNEKQPFGVYASGLDIP